MNMKLFLGALLRACQMVILILLAFMIIGALLSPPVDDDEIFSRGRGLRQRQALHGSEGK
jgi:hypothetical protein